MNCRSFRSVVVDLAADRMEDGSERASALHHARDCRVCAARLADEEALGRRLEALRTGREQASPSVETALRVAFRSLPAAGSPVRHERREPGYAHFWRWAWLGALTVLLVTVSLRIALLPSAPQPLEEAGRAPASGPYELTTDFMPITYPADPAQLHGGQLLRVQMPRMTMVRFGLPVNADRLDEPVQADLLVGPDGVARAIRFVF